MQWKRNGLFTLLYISHALGLCLNLNFSQLEGSRDIVGSTLTNQDLLYLSSEVEQPTSCLLGPANQYLKRWITHDGSLRVNELSGLDFHVDFSNKANDEDLLKRDLKNLTEFNNVGILYLSLAHIGLTRVPNSVLVIINSTVKYISLLGNNFYTSTIIKPEPYDWARFPMLPELLELDLRNCSISYIYYKTFDVMPKLEKLYMSNNRITQISADMFASIPNLIHLDLSSNDYFYEDTPSNYNPYEKFISGLQIKDDTFQNLSNIRFIDFSRTKISATSAQVFGTLGKSLKQLSLCYTGMPLLESSMFTNTNLRVLDLSGNPSTATHMSADALNGLDGSLEVLFYKNSAIKNIEWVQNLTSLRILNLSGNNINVLNNSTFRNLLNLEIVDLSDNHINNWYYSVFSNNLNLRILNLRQNNINFMTVEMLNDFDHLRYLSMGANNFVCSCNLRDFFDVATRNTRPVNCTLDLPNIDDEINDIVVGDMSRNAYSPLFEEVGVYDVDRRIERSYLSTLPSSRINITTYAMNLTRLFYNFSPSNSSGSFLRRERSNRTLDDIIDEIFAGSESLNFTFQLLDFQTNDYKCINSSTSDELFFSELDNCDRTNILPEDVINMASVIFFSTTGVIVFILIIIMFVYWKWYFFKYFFVLFKNATILSFLDKDAKKKVMNFEHEFNYDLFVSYCDENRPWIIDELLPNIEDGVGIRICLHERDFQVGLSILENIVSCMDRSKILLLVISEEFLQSQWCQFEMHLAQHRLLETRRDQLILVLLQEIPKRKRPKTLQYLMMTKTYIVWPKKDTTIDSRKIFWKRLKRAIKVNERLSESETQTVTDV